MFARGLVPRPLIIGWRHMPRMKWGIAFISRNPIATSMKLIADIVAPRCRAALPQKGSAETQQESLPAHAFQPVTSGYSPSQRVLSSRHWK